MQRFKNAYSRTKTYIEDRQEWKQINSIYLKYKDFTMIPAYMYRANLRLIQKFHEVEGAIVECGTWKGGMSGGIAELLGADRKYFLFDSFEGLPEAKEIDGKNAQEWQNDTDASIYHDNCTASIDDAKMAMKISPAKSVSINKGWFSDTLPHYDGGPIAILRLDGDWYESTMQCLENLYPKLVEGGLMIIDDYHHWTGCARAVHEYLFKINSASRICQFNDNMLAYVVKTEADQA